MKKRDLLPLVVLLAAFPAAADEWLECRKAAMAKPRTTAVHCFYFSAKAHGDWQRARLELDALGAAEDDPFFLFTRGRVRGDAEGGAAGEADYAKAAEFFAAAGNSEWETFARNNWLRCLDNRGDFAGAAEQSRLLEELANRSGSPVAIANAVLMRAQIAISAGQLDEAEALLLRYPLEKLDQLDPKGTLAIRALSQQGRLDYALGRVVAALRSAEERAARAAGVSDLEARALYDVAAAHTALPASAANRDAAKAAARRAVVAAERIGMNELIAASLLLVGRLESDPGRLERCAELTRKTGDSRNFTACRLAAAALLAESEPARALVLLEEGERAGESAADPTVLLYPWNDALRAAFALRPRAAALAQAEAFLQRVEQVRAAEKNPELRAALFGTWRELHSWLAGRLLASHDPGEQETAFLLLERARARELQEALATREAPIAVSGFAELAQRLAPDTALLTFHLDEDNDLSGHRRGGAAVFVTTRAGTRVLPLPGRNRVDQAVTLLLGVVGRREDENTITRGLGELLFGEVEKILPAEIRRLVLVPDGSLYELPWALLRDRAGLRLADRFELSILPAASLLGQPPKEARQGGAFVLADPELSPSLPGVSSLPPLPLARGEGREVHRLLGGRLLVGSEATARQLEEPDLESYALLHFAAHAVLDHERPQKSALLLAPDQDDGRLEPAEIARLPLRGQLVTLAGCRSARGRILSGEGPMSLGRAFLVAGAGAVLGSLWELRDDEARQLFVRFYRHLAKGQSAASALALAQRELAAAGAPAAAWAGVVLFGEGGFRVEPTSPIGQAWRSFDFRALLGLLAALAFLAFLFARRYESRRLD